MKTEEIKLKIQALVDNELPDEEVREVLSFLESSYEYREEYINLLKLDRTMKGINFPEPAQEWIDALEKKRGRKLFSLLGKTVFIGSYILLLAYALYDFFNASSAGLAVKLLIGGGIAGFIILLGITIGDRISESRSDKYKGVIR